MSVQLGFIDHGEGANIRTIPAELSGSRCLTSAPLPPGTRVTVIRPHPQKPEWSYVATLLGESLLRGYVQGFRLTTALPEPSATLYHVKPGDMLEPIAARTYHQGIEPGRDLRFYENVVLSVNQQARRAGVRRVDGDVRLVAGHRIWLVSVAFANELQKLVPSGSITGGAVALARKVARHLEDILASVRGSPQYFEAVAGEYASVIREHLPEIIGIVVAFIAAEAVSTLLAATPTGVGQLAAAVIQLGLAAFGAQGVVEAGAEALKHAQAWLTQAWKAHGEGTRIGEASKSFLRMLVSIALAALGMLGLKSNLGRGLKLAQGVKITPPSLVMMQTAGGPGGAVAVPVFRPGSITATHVAAVSSSPMTGPTAALTQAGNKGSAADPKLTNRTLGDAELEKFLEKLPNWDKLQKLVGRRIPKPGTPEFAALKKQLEAAGYQLDVLKEGPQPFRLRRPNGKALGDEYAALTVTEEGMIVLKVNGTNRISVYSRYRKNYLDWVEQTSGKAARDAAAARISAGDQLHHLIPDEIAQSHPLIRQALERLDGYTIDRGTNMLDMPVAKNPEGKILHLGSHPEYNKYVSSKLDFAVGKLGAPSKLTPKMIDGAIRKVESELRKAIESGNLPPKVLKELIEDGIPVGKKLAMLELRHHAGSRTA
jgi:hypothetical protein